MIFFMVLKFIHKKKFANGVVYALETEDGYPVEVTDTFLPFYTKKCVNGTNALKDYHLGSRAERWMIGVSVMSGCPIGCKFCATGQLKRWRNLTSLEILEQIAFVMHESGFINPSDSQEFKINFTRMGEPFLNIDVVKHVIKSITKAFPNVHCYVSTIGIKGSDFSWIKDNTTLQFSVHSFVEERRDNLIPYRNKMTLKEMGQVRTKSNLKTTVNLTLVDKKDFSIRKLRKYFNKEHFFIKLSPINTNAVSDTNDMGIGAIKQVNLQ